MPINLNLQHSYHALGADFSAEVLPTPTKKPSLIHWNRALAEDLCIDVDYQHSDLPKVLANIFSGNQLLSNMKAIAQAYAGHQFGNFTILGDGRAILLGEILKHGKCYDIQLKGSGRTPFSRRGDGRAALGPMLREMVVSEAMCALGIPSTRALALVSTGEKVLRDQALPGAVLTRIAHSHIRVGSFEYFWAKENYPALKKLLQYSCQRHFPQLDVNSPTLAVDFLASVAELQAELICHWLRVGFIHGVMNTDNMSIAGETIDFGPCAFLDEYNPDQVFSSIDTMKRYSYANQPSIARWNLTCLAESLLPLCADLDIAITAMGEVLAKFQLQLEAKILRMRMDKIALADIEEAKVTEWLNLLSTSKSDYTNSHLILHRLAEDTINGKFSNDFADTLCPNLTNDKNARAWLIQWQKNFAALPLAWQKQKLKTMQNVNPQLIPRNHRLEQVIRAAEDAGDFSPMLSLINALANPYQSPSSQQQYLQQEPSELEKIRATFCGT